MEEATRRRFLRTLLRGGLAAGAGATLTGPYWFPRLVGTGAGEAAAANTLSEILKTAPKARYWVSTRTEGVSCRECHLPSEIAGIDSHTHRQVFVKCGLCAQSCRIGEGERGKCRTRMNVEGELRSLVYGRPVSIHADPIEKKPFYHFLPGKLAYSLATAGCPLHCKFCQNWQLSQMKPEDYDSRYIGPEEIVAQAIAADAPIIAYTYNEPTVFTEYLLDIAEIGRREGLRSVLISCGFMQEEPLRDMCNRLDAIKIDLKGYSENFYRKVCDAELKPVLRSIKQVAQSGTHLEIVNLVVPTLNDSTSMLRELAKWVAGEVGPDVPVHFTRFHPDYQLLNLSPTPVGTLERAREIALEEGIHYPFVGNVPGHPGNHTYCPQCGRVVIERAGFWIQSMNLEDGRCGFCGREIAGVFEM